MIIYNGCKEQEKREMACRDTSKQYIVKITANEPAFEPRCRTRPSESGSLLLYYEYSIAMRLSNSTGIVHEWRQALARACVR